MVLFPCKADEQTTFRRGVLASVMRVRLLSMALSNVGFAVGCLGGVAVLLGLLSLTPVGAGGKIGWVEIAWVEVGILCFVAFATVGIIFKASQSIPRRVTLGRKGLWVQTRETCETIPWEDCRWWIGTLADDVQLMGYGSHQIPAVVIEYFEPGGESRLIAVGTTPESSRRWQIGLNRRRVRHQEPPRGRLRSCWATLCGFAAGVLAGGFLAALHFAFCMTGLCVPSQGDVAGYLLLLGLTGSLIGTAAALHDGFRLKKRDRNLAVTGILSVKIGAFLIPIGGPVMFLLGGLTIFGLATLAFRIASHQCPWEGLLPPRPAHQPQQDRLRAGSALSGA